MKTKKTILGAALGSCVHIAGLNHFLKIAEAEGFKTILLGPAVPNAFLINEVEKNKPDLVAVSYRLTPDTADILFDELMRIIGERNLTEIPFIFGGTPPVAEIAKKYNFFKKVFSGKESLQEIKQFLRGGSSDIELKSFPNNLLSRVEEKYPYPILRHHFGRPTIEETIAGVRLIAESEVLDVISLGPDQNAQEHFFHQVEMDPKQNGAGGVPIRKAEDLKAIFKASKYGNFPLMRCYSGTRDLLKWAKMSLETINNAWAAIPLTWYSVMDGRSKRTLSEAIKENQSTMKWYAEKGIPVEVNESHQWSLRDAHDSLAVTMAFLAAYNAKKMGVRNYVSQFMFNTPPGTFPSMDIAKMLAKRELIESLQSESFSVIREVRSGIAHFSADSNFAKGQLASSIVFTLALQPHILHVVGFSEGDHATYPEELIESCKITHGVLQNSLYGLPDMTYDSKVMKRKNDLLIEAQVLLEALKNFGKNMSDDPWSDAKVIELAIEQGLLDAPHFRGNPYLCGKIVTQLIDGAWYAIDESTRKIIYEKERTDKILSKL